MEKLIKGDLGIAQSYLLSALAALRNMRVIDAHDDIKTALDNIVELRKKEVRASKAYLTDKD